MADEKQGHITNVGMPQHLFDVANRYPDIVAAGAQGMINTAKSQPVPHVPPDDQTAVAACICLAAAGVLSSMALAKR